MLQVSWFASSLKKTSVQKFAVCFWSKMVLKGLAELTTDELMSEFGKAGFEEEFSESLALVKLTIYLVGYQCSCSCSVCENWAVKTKEERPDGWPPDIPALSRTMGKRWDTRKYQEMTN